MLSSRWLHVVALLLTTFGGAFAAAPSNDEPAGATLISVLPFSTTQNTTGATGNAADPVHSCTGGFRNANTVWFRYLANFTGILQVDTSGSSYDTVLSGYPGSSSPGAQMACNDDANNNFQSAINLSVVSGTSYLIEASSSNPGGGTLSLNARGCTYSISPPTQSFTAAGGTAGVTVSTSAGCGWTIGDFVPYFVNVTSGSSGSGNGTVNYSVGANPSASVRSGNLTIAGKTYSFSQAASGLGVPNLTGMTQMGAITSLQNASLNLGTVTNASSPTVPAGRVISQSPVSGTLVASFSNVNLTVSTGPSLGPADFGLLFADQTVLPEEFAIAGAAVPVTFDPITLKNLTAGPVNLTVTVATNAGGNWLSPSFLQRTLTASGQTTLTLTADTTHVDPLIDGTTYIGTVTVKSATTTVYTIVTLGVSGLKIMANWIIPASAFPNVALGSIPAGAQAPIETKVTVKKAFNYPDTNVSITRFENNGAGWLNIDTVALDTESSFKVTTSTSALSAGTYTGTVALQGSGFQEVDIFVSVTVVTMVSVPNVVGSTQAAASSAIQGVGLVLGTVGSASSPSVPAGSVISQNPTSGTQVALGSAVNLTVSTGPALVSVPNVTGLTQLAGASAIQNAGLILGTVTNTFSATVPAGTIISQSPASGTQVALGSTVNLTVSTGTIPVTVDTSPSGLLIVVDNATYTAPHTFDWVPANPHTISAPSPQTQNGTQFTFSNWSNGGPATQQVAAANPTTFTAQYTGAPVSRVLSHLVAGGEWTTGILVINKGNSQAQFSITFYGNTGQSIALPFSSGSTGVLSGTVAASGSAYFEASNPNINFITGWGKVTADPFLVIQAIFRRKVSPTRYYEAAVPTTSSATDFTFPFDATNFAVTVPFFTGITFSNQDSTQIATVNCTARDTAGTIIPNAIGVITMSPLGHYSDFLFPGLTGKRGTIRCTSNTTVSTIPLRFIGVDAFSTLPVVDPNQVLTPGTRALSHLASGGEWTTGIEIVNTGDTTAQYSIAFYGNNGLSVALPFSGGSTSVLTGALPARGSTYVEASNPNIPNNQVISAWGRVTADPSIVVQAIFRRNVSQIFYEAAVSSSFGSTSFIVPFDATIFTDANLPFYTGFAVANTDPTLTADITCVTRDSTGTLIPNAVTVPQLAPFGHWAEFLFPALTGKRGTITCTSNRTVATTVLRFIGVDGFSTLPIILP